MNTYRNRENSNAFGAVRARIEREYPSLSEQQSHSLQLALNEAEAVAWESDFPQLVFPALATEKVDKLARWQERQDAIRRRGISIAFAA